ncbi:cob(I)yrinic acid a,c-diamide adenosyltransferase [Candidatus Parvarchaeota archaeon]|jgi:cob(I)alamin adenosyltransferase|nr:cob(I)yrinic acid a,c-diamide adenosyltransferase [Candidatus Parvarchaeota archaeon]
MKYYSGKGDEGITDIAGKRIEKDDNLIELIGILDELNAFVGYSISKINYEDIKTAMRKVESKIYAISAYASGYSVLIKREKEGINRKDVDELEKEIDSFAGELKDITRFLYPNGSEAACIINICRTIARKAERSAIKCKLEKKEVLAYLNRLSSLLFVLSRVVNKRDGFNEEFF